MTETSTACAIPPFATKAARLAWWKSKIASDPKWAIRALERIYAFQTAAEKAVGVTKEDNGVGFGGRDSDILSKFAQQVAAWKAAPQKKFPSPLSPKQTALVQRLMPKYTAQLLGHLEAEGTLAPLVKGAPEAAPAPEQKVG